MNSKLPVSPDAVLPSPQTQSPNTNSSNTRVLIIGYVWPEPNSSAAGSRMLALIEACRQQQWQVCFASPAQDSPHRANLDDYQVDVQAINLNCSSFDDFAREYAPDIVIFDRFMMEEQFGWRIEQACPDAVRVLDTEDLHCLRQARHKALKQQTAVSDALLFSDIAQREIAAILRCDLSLMISEYEMQLLTDKFRVDPALLCYCPFMLKQKPLPELSFEQRRGFVCIGNFRHAPNWDAVLWMKQQIWPRIRKLMPDAEINIFGAYPPPKATALHAPKQGFWIRGWAEDANEVMTQARVCLAPLRFGAGLKGKLVEAMQCGTPSVTTAIGAEGMAGELPWPGAIADDMDALAEQAVALYHDKNRWLATQQQGQHILRQRFDYDSIQQQLIQRLEWLQSHLPQHRLANFTGSMLRHHHHKSTQYMAQWIESKNKLKDLTSQ